MERSLHAFKRSLLVRSLGTVLALSAVVCAPPASAQWAVIDPANLVESILQEINQLEQIAGDRAAAVQQLREYKLELENLKQLPGNLRNEVKDELRRQLLSNVRDYGRSVLNKMNTQDPNSGSYYVVAEDIVSTGIGNVPRTTASTDVDLINLGIAPGQNSGIGRDVAVDRQHYDRVMDDMRQVAVTRKNSEYRETKANHIAQGMANLKDNNTVGALQLMSAQNSLTYAQNEDLVKVQAAILKNEQENQLRQLVAKEQARKQELSRLQKLRTEPQVTNIDMTP